MLHLHDILACEGQADLQGAVLSPEDWSLCSTISPRQVGCSSRQNPSACEAVHEAPAAFGFLFHNGTPRDMLSPVLIQEKVSFFTQCEVFPWKLKP